MTSRLGKQLAEIVSALNSAGVRYALIGGLALAAYKVIRATQDVDVLVAIEDADRVDLTLKGLHYENLHRGADAGNYRRGDERIDLLYANRAIARRLLSDASPRQTLFGPFPVIRAEGLIGFKLQAFINNPRRTQDLEDIRALLRANHAILDMVEVRDYFRLFDREPLLDEILNAIG